MKQILIIGKRIKEMREAKGWTQEVLSEATGIHRVTIARYETTDNGMTVESAIRIAKALGCTVNDLLDPGDKTGTA